MSINETTGLKDIREPSFSGNVHLHKSDFNHR